MNQSNRLVAFADGVFAVVVTLLVLDIRLPERVDSGVWTWLITNWVKFFSFFLSFFLTGVYWINHQETFQYIHRVNRTMLVLSLIFLFFVTLLPFSTTLISQQPTDLASPIIYSLNLFLVGMSLYAQQRYAIQHPRFGDDDDRQNYYLQRVLKIRILAPSLIYAAVIASALAGWGTRCYLFFVGIPLVQAILNRWLAEPLNPNRKKPRK